MPKVVIDGVEYIPKADVPSINNKSLQECLEILTEMRYHNQQYKMKALAWDAIHALSPELAELDEEAAYDRIHGGDC